MGRICGAFRIEGTGEPLGGALIARMWGVSEETLRGSESVRASGDGRLVMACVSEAAPGTPDMRYPPAASRDGGIHVVFEGVLTRAEGVSDERLKRANPGGVIAEAFAERGAAVFGEIEGEYAFALADTRKGLLYLVRDKCGLKQMYYAVHGGICFFGSRVKSILNVLPQLRRLCEKTLYHYVAFGAAPPPLTFFEGINKLAAGDYALVSSRGAEHKSYWKPWERREKITGSEGEIAEELLRRLKAAAGRRLEAGRKTAVFLSGGMDSSAVTALVAEQSAEPVHTFTLGLDKTWGELPAHFDEVPFARAVAKKYNTIHHEFYIGRQDYFKDVEEAALRLGEPIATSEIGMLDIVCKAAREEGIEVVFNGEGSDTILFGSSLYGTVSALMQGKWRKVMRWPRFVHKAASLMLNILALRHPDRWTPFEARWNMYRLARGREPYAGKAYLLPDVLQNSLFRRDFLKRVGGEMSYSYIEKYIRAINHAAPDAPVVDHLVYRDFPFWLGEYYAVENEKVPAFHGMDVRSPIFDPSIISFSLGTPLDMKIRPDGQTKYLLRRAMEGLLPREVIYRPKVGFSTPVEKWLRETVPDFFMEAYNGSKLREAGVFRDERMRELCRAQKSGRANVLWLLFSLYLVLRWHDRWLA